MLGSLKPAKGPFVTGDIKQGQNKSSMKSVTQSGFQIQTFSYIQKQSECIPKPYYSMFMQ